MEKLCYKLPAKAKDIVQELANEELYQINFYAYLSLCCTQYGYFKAADHFQQESKNERYHFEQLAQYLQSRGEEAEVSAVPEPKIKFTDLRSGVKAAYEMEISVTETYDEAIKEMMSIDIMTYAMLMRCLENQKYRLEAMQKMWVTFGDLQKPEEQKEAEANWWGGQELVAVN